MGPAEIVIEHNEWSKQCSQHWTSLHTLPAGMIGFLFRWTFLIPKSNLQHLPVGLTRPTRLNQEAITYSTWSKTEPPPHGSTKLASGNSNLSVCSWNAHGMNNRQCLCPWKNSVTSPTSWLNRLLVIKGLRAGPLGLAHRYVYTYSSSSSLTFSHLQPMIL